MPRILPLLLLCLTLLMAACKKDKAEPEPALEGRWYMVSDITSLYDPTGKLLRTVPYGTPEEFGIDFTATSMQIFSIKLNSPFRPPITFKREGNKLIYDNDGHVGQIVTLTQHQLVLLFENYNTFPDGSYTNEVYTCSR